MTELEQDVLENPFAVALREAKERKARQQASKKRRNQQQHKAPSAQNGRAAYYNLKEFKRRIAEIEAMKVAAKNAGMQWSEGIEGPIVNPRIQKSAVRAWRPIFTKLMSEDISEEGQSSILFELMLGMGVSDGAITNGQMRYLKGVSKKGWFDEIRRIPISSPGVVYFIAAFEDISELVPKERSDFHRFFRSEQASVQRPFRLRLDRVISRWVGSTRPPRR